MFPREAFITAFGPTSSTWSSIDSPPGWFAETGWHLTPETLNISEQQGRSEGIAQIRNRPDAALLVLGGENIAAAGGKPARVSVTIGDRQIDEWDVAAGDAFLQAHPARAGSAGRRGTVQHGWWCHTKALMAGRNAFG